MIFNRDVLKIDSEYHLWTDEQLQAHYLPQMRTTEMSKRHYELADQKRAKQQAAAAKKLLNEEKKALALAKREAAAAEKAKVAGMDAATRKAYLKNKKLQAQLDKTNEPKLL